MEKRFAVSKCEAIDIMRKAIAKMENMDDDTIFVLTIDLEGNGMSNHGKRVTIKSGANMIERSETRILSGNRYVSQLDLYSVRQPDIKNIRKKGIMKTIILPGIKWNEHLFEKR